MESQNSTSNEVPVISGEENPIEKQKDSLKKVKNKKSGEGLKQVLEAEEELSSSSQQKELSPEEKEQELKREKIKLGEVTEVEEEENESESGSSSQQKELSPEEKKEIEEIEHKKTLDLTDIQALLEKKEDIIQLLDPLLTNKIHFNNLLDKQKEALKDLITISNKRSLIVEYQYNLEAQKRTLDTNQRETTQKDHIKTLNKYIKETSDTLKSFKKLKEFIAKDNIKNLIGEVTAAAEIEQQKVAEEAQRLAAEEEKRLQAESIAKAERKKEIEEIEQQIQLILEKKDEILNVTDLLKIKKNNSSEPSNPDQTIVEKIQTAINSSSELLEDDKTYISKRLQTLINTEDNNIIVESLNTIIQKRISIIQYQIQLMQFKDNIDNIEDEKTEKKIAQLNESIDEVEKILINLNKFDIIITNQSFQQLFTEELNQKRALQTLKELKKQYKPELPPMNLAGEVKIKSEEGEREPNSGAVILGGGAEEGEKPNSEEEQQAVLKQKINDLQDLYLKKYEIDLQQHHVEKQENDIKSLEEQIESLKEKILEKEEILKNLNAQEKSTKNDTQIEVITKEIEEKKLNLQIKESELTYKESELAAFISTLNEIDNKKSEENKYDAICNMIEQQEKGNVSCNLTLQNDTKSKFMEVLTLKKYDINFNYIANVITIYNTDLLCWSFYHPEIRSSFYLYQQFDFIHYTLSYTHTDDNTKWELMKQIKLLLNMYDLSGTQGFEFNEISYFINHDLNKQNVITFPLRKDETVLEWGPNEWNDAFKIIKKFPIPFVNSCINAMTILIQNLNSDVYPILFCLDEKSSQSKMIMQSIPDFSLGKNFSLGKTLYDAYFFYASHVDQSISLEKYMEEANITKDIVSYFGETTLKIAKASLRREFSMLNENLSHDQQQEPSKNKIKNALSFIHDDEKQSDTLLKAFEDEYWNKTIIEFRAFYTDSTYEEKIKICLKLLFLDHESILQSYNSKLIADYNTNSESSIRKTGNVTNFLSIFNSVDTQEYIKTIFKNSVEESVNIVLKTLQDATPLEKLKGVINLLHDNYNIDLQFIGNNIQESVEGDKLILDLEEAKKAELKKHIDNMDLVNALAVIDQNLSTEIKENFTLTQIAQEIIDEKEKTKLQWQKKEIELNELEVQLQKQDKLIESRDQDIEQMKEQNDKLRQLEELKQIKITELQEELKNLQQLTTESSEKDKEIMTLREKLTTTSKDSTEGKKEEKPSSWKTIGIGVGIGGILGIGTGAIIMKRQQKSQLLNNETEDEDDIDDEEEELDDSDQIINEDKEKTVKPLESEDKNINTESIEN